MADNPETPTLLKTNQPDLFFEDNTVGRLKKEIWEASDEEVDADPRRVRHPLALANGPSPARYIQTTVRHQVEANRRKNDIVLIPVGCTENHGEHTGRAHRTPFFVSQISRGCGATPPSGAAPSAWRCRRSTTAAIPTTTWACPARSSCARRWCGSC